MRRIFHTLDQSRVFDSPPGDLSVVFLNDRQISRLHREFMDDPEPTDVITFTGDTSMGFAGEICVSAERAAIIADEKGLDFSRELTLYLVHGYLHLCGHDDKDPKARLQMRRAEKKALSLLEKSGNLPIFDLSDLTT